MFRRMSVGSELDSYCGKCKLVLNHVVVAMVDEQPRRVRCLTCNSEHNHRIQKAATRKSSSGSRSRSSASSAAAAASRTTRWQSSVANWDDEAAKKYSIYGSFEVDDKVTHSKFGKGVVIDVPSPDRMIALFQTGEKMLLQGKRRA